MTTNTPWRPLPLDRFLIGVAHYPEHESPDCIEHEADLMAEAGVEVARMGEFAWNIIEPRRGEFSFDLFDRVIAALGERGIETIFCTPTATPPRWLTHKRPDILRQDAKGRNMRHGSRQHADIINPYFREESRRITGVLAEHYRDHSHVIGWQTDNELNTHFSESHSAAAAQAFRLWLVRKYGSINELNHAWGTVFWNRQYDDFDQVETPVQNSPAAADPSHMLDYHRFLADTTADFNRDQAEILKAANPDWFVFHNIGRLNDTNLRDFAKDVDFMGVDVYPHLIEEFAKLGLGFAQAMQIDAFRGWAGNFIVPEQQTGFGGQPGFASASPEPGELRRMTFSSIARGADGIIFFRWRTARFGAEAYWMGILDHDGIKRRRFYELKETIAEIKSVRDEILGTCVETDVAIVAADWDNQQAQDSYGLGLPGIMETTIPLHHYLYSHNIGCGFAAPWDDLSRCRLAYIPHLPIWDEAWTDQIDRAVHDGLTLIVGARTGTRDSNNHVLPVTPPGPLAGLCGVKVLEYGRLPAPGAASMVSGANFQVGNIRGGRTSESAKRLQYLQIGEVPVLASYWYEILEADDGTQVIAYWTSRSLAGNPAITRRRHGKGSVIYIGTYLSGALVDALIAPLLDELDIRAPLAAPPGVEVTVRSGNGRRLTFIQNIGAEPAILSNGAEQIALEGYGCTLLRS
jgi:beta-galactosidase